MYTVCIQSSIRMSVRACARVCSDPSPSFRFEISRRVLHIPIPVGDFQPSLKVLKLYCNLTFMPIWSKAINVSQCEQTGKKVSHCSLP